ncbi:hypothetical protein OIU74_005795 [Salix koriyanagi]|uniref:Uncharacterized protein n=1 Tax=Salix koriyanagi TaxID=2511006 RepID=A0A9Q0NU99_9ROSI|nr:hypothetical protein OIU74_005795 [Salix koriyanagi]
MGIVPAAVPPASARNAEAWADVPGRGVPWSRDRVEGCSRRGRGIKLPGLRSCVGPPSRSRPHGVARLVPSPWPAASELRRAAP